MSGIRPLDRADLAEVCGLYERVARSGSDELPPELVGYFERTLLDHPWFDPDIPSLVYEAPDGEIVGFLGSYVRRIRVDGRRLRLACSGQLVSAPGTRHRGVGALLLRRYLAGPQDVAITDCATDYIRRIWTGLGGTTETTTSIGWVKVLRPAKLGVLLARRQSRRSLGRVLAAVGPGLDAAARHLADRLPGSLPERPGTTAQPMSPAGFVEQIANASRFLRLHPDYDLAYLEWLFAELAAVTFRGTPVCQLVLDENGRPVGWYVYYLQPEGIAQVMQVAAPGGDAGAVLDHLFWHADANGAAGVVGRVEAHIVSDLRRCRCMLIPSDWRLVRSGDQALLALLGSSDALLTRLDGEWWMGHRSLWLTPETISARPAAAPMP